MVDGTRARPRTDVEKNADVWLENRAEGVEEPAVRVDLLLVLLLEAKYYLNGDDALLRAFNLVRFRDRDCVFSQDETEKIIIMICAHVLWVVYSYICAATGLPLTTLVAIPS